MSKVGIIANPAAGKDIRRLVAYASLTGNREKIDLVRRIILGIDSTGVDEILLMPDYSGLCPQALSGLGGEKLRAHCRILDMRATGTQTDSSAAMALMAEMGAGCVVTIGGDGTSRAVAKGNRDVPVVAVSTGTNNVFPMMVEATVAGIAAGVMARGIVDEKKVVTTHKRVIISENGVEQDMALIDAVVLDQPFIGARAVWTISEIKEMLCTRAQPDTIGLSSIGGSICTVLPEDDCGLYLKLGEGKLKVRAAVLPGVIREVPVAEYRRVKLGEEIPVSQRPSLLALDGEREFKVSAEDNVTMRVERDGPRVVDVTKAVREAAAKGFFIDTQKSKH
ncbi:MAG: NAD(+)/NADH kinase [Dehalococcoidia bacterium]|nr:NAD(+)/NADH kinase [Dehalococcoidia bacterium]